MKEKRFKNPIPQGKYLPALRDGSIIYTSGMTPRKDGVLLYQGKIKTSNDINQYKEAVELASLNAIGAVHNLLKDGETIKQVLQLQVFLNTESDFVEHAQVANFASEVIIEFFGVKAVGVRAAIGVASLPGDAPVEIMMVCKIDTTHT